jgi:hypothetical protein
MISVPTPDYDRAAAFQFNKVINKPDFPPLHIVARAATLMREQCGKLVATPLGRSMLSDARRAIHGGPNAELELASL